MAFRGCSLHGQVSAPCSWRHVWLLLTWVSLIDRAEQYFIAGATRSASTDGDELVEDSSTWFGCETVPTPGGLCEVRA